MAPGIEELVRQLAERVDALERESRILREENSILKRGLFGRGPRRIDAGQLALWAGGEAPPSPAVDDAAPDH